MRLHLLLRVPKHCNISFNYSYYLSSAIYQWIENSSPAYSAFLHDQGFPLEETTRRFKHFCFSQLVIPQRKITNGRIEILSDKISWYISMPIEESLRHLIVGLFEKQSLYIEHVEQCFYVEHVEILPEPRWDTIMAFRMLSPLTVSIPESRNGRLIPQYLFPDDARLSSSLQNNILNKYRSLYRKEPYDNEFQCSLDEKFIADRGGYSRITKLITIKTGRTDESQVRGFMCPVTIKGNVQLMKLAYESGLGEKGSMGFGMIEMINLTKKQRI